MTTPEDPLAPDPVAGDTPGTDGTAATLQPAEAPRTGRHAQRAPSPRRHVRPADGTPARRKPSVLGEIPVIIILALLVSLVVKTFLVQAFWIPSGSMQNTLELNDRVLVSKLTMRIGTVHRGDVVVFKDPGGWLTETPVEAPGLGHDLRQALRFVGLAPANDNDLVKRVIGVGGDHVTCCTAKGLVQVNGVALDETPYLYPGNAPGDCPSGSGAQCFFDVRVPKGEIWVMGDHRQVSEDSRVHTSDARGGMVPLSDVVGRAFVVVWPLSRWHGIGRPPTFAQSGLRASAAAH